VVDLRITTSSENLYQTGNKFNQGGKGKQFVNGTLTKENTLRFLISRTTRFNAARFITRLKKLVEKP
jgi:hypothetical protein